MVSDMRSDDGLDAVLVPPLRVANDGTFALYSLHGRATLLTYTGGPGTLRAVQNVGGKLASHIRLAIARRRASKAEYLRDEMREHFRLKEAGVLQQEMYEASKARILAQHAPVTRP